MLFQEFEKVIDILEKRGEVIKMEDADGRFKIQDSRWKILDGRC